jgi:hypothetical protein
MEVRFGQEDKQKAQSGVEHVLYALRDWMTGRWRGPLLMGKLTGPLLTGGGGVFRTAANWQPERTAADRQVDRTAANWQAERTAADRQVDRTAANWQISTRGGQCELSVISPFIGKY